MSLFAPELIARKRDGGQLSEEELAFLIGGFLTEQVSEGQMAAFLMAGVLRGFSTDEAHALTRILLDSGETVDLSALRGPTIDKHSTGGVSDGTTLLVAPLLASAGAQLVKLSGRGLGHTGGTLDKLESIPGFTVDLEPEALLAIADRVGCVVAAQTARLVPADKALYALRDVTGTVPSPALIASSVMSKKLAAGAQTIVLDVKAGDGAFMPTQADAHALAELCVAIGNEAGRHTSALVTAMDQPLGTAVGNALEVVETVELLSNPPQGRLCAVALELATSALVDARGEPADAVRDDLVARWSAGEALERLRDMIVAQGGEAAVCDDPRGSLPTAPVTVDVTAPSGGHVAALPARAIGELAATLGAGRSRPGEDIDPAVGIVFDVEVGDEIGAGDRVAVVHGRNPQAADEVAQRLGALITVSGAPVPRPPVLLSHLA